jgi:mRNA interferase MazF
MEVKRGDVIIVAHGNFGRPRPAIIVQADELGEATTTLLVCPVTSDLTDRLPVRPTVEPKAENGLRIKSQIMTDKMLAIPRDHVRQHVGKIDTETRGQLDSALLLVLGLTR